MRQILVTYLLVTGIGGAIVVAAPTLVILGYMFLILPGFLMSLLPTAFLYGAIFALAWFPLHGHIGEVGAAIIAALLTAAVVYAAPIPGNRVTEARYRTEIADDMVPATPVVLAGHLRIDHVTAQDRKQVDGVLASRARSGGKLSTGAIQRLDQKCDDLCMALLFQDGVESVTVSADNSGDPRTLSPEAATYRLVERTNASCTTLVPRPQSWSLLTGWPNTLPALRDYWKLRLSTDRCLVRVPTRTVPDLQIVASSLVAPLPAKTGRYGKVLLGPRAIDVQRLEIFDGAGRRLLRQTGAQAQRVTQPLMYTPSGSMENFHFDWAAGKIGLRDRNGFAMVPLLERHAGLDLSVDSAGLAGGIRDELAAVLADPARVIEKPTVDMVPAFFDAMARRDVPAAEIDLAFRIIGDRRFGNFDRIYQLMAAMGDDAGRLKVPIVARLLTADPERDAALKSLGELLARLPPATFATLTADDKALLADGDRRTLASGLIARQPDRGAAAAPLLVAILGEQLRLATAEPRSRKSWEKRDHWAAVQAAMAGLTRIGPAAAGQLGAVEALVAQGLVHDGMRNSEGWQLLLMRLGKPVDAIPEPERPSIITKDFHGRLRSVLARYERDLEREAARQNEPPNARRRR